jgi:hypothetical protein
VSSLTDQLATLALQVVGILAAVGLLVALTVGRRPTRAQLRLASAAVVGVLAVALVAGQIPSGASLLNQGRRASVSARDGVEYCFGQPWPGNPQGGGSARLPFLHWLRSQLGVGAVYSLAFASPPDRNCVLLGLLPALPARPGERAAWTIAWGVVPPAMLARIAAHDPSVRVFAPGFALQRNGLR